MEPGAFCGLKGLRELDLSNNKLANAPELLPVKPTLKTLKLGENMIQYFPSNYFEGFLVLQAVNLDYNGLYSASNIGNIGHSLKIFAITNNKLREMDNKLTGGLNMTVLKNIRAQNNEIQYFEVAILAQMPKLDFLHLGENRLQHMDDPTVYLHPLNVAGWPLALVLHLNPLNCDKRLSWLLTLAKQGRMEEN